MEKTKVYVAREQDGSYSLFMDEKSNLPYGLVGEGASAREAMDEWMRAYDDMRSLFNEEGREFVEADFSFTYDVPSFLSYYGGLITFKGLSKLTGISAAQLSQYASGYRSPSPKTTMKIQESLRAFASDLSNLSLV